VTEAEWLSCPDPQRLLAHLGDRADERIRRRFACACCRRVWDLLGKEGRRHVRVVEEWTDGRFDATALGRTMDGARREVAAAKQAAHRQSCALTPIALELARRAIYLLAMLPDSAARDAAAARVVQTVATEPIDETLTIGVGAEELIIYHNPSTEGDRGSSGEQAAVRRRTDQLQDAYWSERRVQADILRCLAPWAPAPAFDPRWRTVDVLGLARAAWEDEAFDRLPLLADALMDAGCDEPAVLAHCRSAGPHVRGCWVLDRLRDDATDGGPTG
jgi:hypothetical protein